MTLQNRGLNDITENVEKNDARLGRLAVKKKKNAERQPSVCSCLYQHTNTPELLHPTILNSGVHFLHIDAMKAGRRQYGLRASVDAAVQLVS